VKPPSRFQSCGVISRVQSLPLFSNKEKLKLLLTGAILIEGSSDPSLTLEDFVSKGSESITDRASPCPLLNDGLVSALKNLSVCLRIVFSNSFGHALDEFIDHLEGAHRIKEIVPETFNGVGAEEVFLERSDQSKHLHSWIISFYSRAMST
jgi:hypothetical protein